MVFALCVLKSVVMHMDSFKSQKNEVGFFEKYIFGYDYKLYKQLD